MQNTHFQRRAQQYRPSERDSPTKHAYLSQSRSSSRRPVLNWPPWLAVLKVSGNWYCPGPGVTWRSTSRASRHLSVAICSCFMCSRCFSATASRISCNCCRCLSFLARRAIAFCRLHSVRTRKRMSPRFPKEPKTARKHMRGEIRDNKGKMHANEDGQYSAQKVMSG